MRSGKWCVLSGLLWTAAVATVFGQTPPPEQIAASCIADMQSIVADYQSTVQGIVDTCVPELQALMDANDRASASQLSVSCGQQIRSEAVAASQQLTSTATTCLAQLGPNPVLVRLVVEAFRFRVREAGQIQANAVDQIIAVIAPTVVGPPPGIIIFTENGITAIERVAELFASNVSSFTDNTVNVIRARIAQGDQAGAEALAEQAKAGLARVADQAEGSVVRFCNLVTGQLKRIPNTGALLSAVNIACSESERSIRETEEDSCDAILAALQ